MKLTMRSLSAALCVVTTMAGPVLAQPGPPDADSQARWEERRERAERRHRVRMTVGLAEALGLSEAEALKLSAKLRELDDKRAPLRDEMRKAMQTLKAASSGDPGALSGVDAAVTTLLNLRSRMAELDKALFATLSRDLAPQQKAQLALFLAKRHGRGGPGEGKGRRGPGRGPGPW